MRKSFLLLALLPFIVCAGANAATYCVNSAASLQAALNASQANGANDFISIVAGNYPLSSGLTFFSNEDYNLSLLGGLNSNCTQLAGRTTLDGQNTVRPLYVVNQYGNTLVEAISFERGYAAEGAGGGLYFVSLSGDLNILLNRFRFNRSLANAGALYANTDTGNVLIYNNLVWGNRANQVGGLVLDQSGGNGRVLNNTIVSNVTDTPTVPGGLLLLGSGTFDVSNNILWDNAPASGADFRADTSHSRRHNDIEIVAGGVPPDLVIGEQSVDPQFADCGIFCVSFDLVRASPLVDAGSIAAVSDLAYQLPDLRGLPRIIGPNIDIGAYENDILLVDGFDP